MSARNMLEQLLRSGLDMLNNGNAANNGNTTNTSNAGQNTPAGQRPNQAPSGQAANPSNWGSFGKGAATAGALALLLGSRQARRLGGKAIKYGGMAAVGMMAYRAYTQWQQSQVAGAGLAQGAQNAPSALGSPVVVPLMLQAPRTVDQALPAEETEAHSRAMLVAMVAAATADGHLDERERGLLDAELARLAGAHGVSDWLAPLLKHPPSAAEVARASTGLDMGAEMYLASLLVADAQSPAERRYLDELAQRLALPPGLKAQLESQAAAG